MENKNTSALGAYADDTITATGASADDTIAGASEDMSTGSTASSKKTNKKMKTAGASKNAFAGSPKMATLADCVSSFRRDETGLLMSNYDLEEENILRTTTLSM